MMLSAVVRKRYTIRLATPDSEYISRCGAEGSCWIEAPPGTGCREEQGRGRSASHQGKERSSRKERRLTTRQRVSPDFCCGEGRDLRNREDCEDSSTSAVWLSDRGSSS